MTDNYSYSKPPPTTSNTERTAHDRPESSDTDAFEPKTPQVHNAKTPKLEWKSALAPIGTFIFGAALAFGHHAFNAWADGRPAATITLPQNWVTRIGVGFSFGFKTALGVTMAFVVLQCLWLSIRRRPLTIKEIDTLYHIERSDNLYQALPQAIFFSPIIVLFSILTLLLPISSVITPGSLTVTTQNYTDVTGPCTIPSGNLSFNQYSDVDASFFVLNGTTGDWNTITPRVTTLTTQWFVEQRIPDLPQACGPNCLYRVSVPSFVIRCQPNPASLPDGQRGLQFAPQNATVLQTTLWNGTTDPNSKWAFYIAWRSNGVGTSGNASCSPFIAQYDVEVRTKGGVQSVTTNVTLVTSPIPEVMNSTPVFDSNVYLWMQLASLSYAVRALLLGNVVIYNYRAGINVNSSTQATLASFLSTDLHFQPEFIWGDVLNGIEDVSHNITAALLSLPLGTTSAECLFDQQVVVYQYNSFALWVPYGTALGVALLSLVAALTIMVKHNTGQITTSFSDTIMATRRLEDAPKGTKLRLSVVNRSKLEYIVD